MATLTARQDCILLSVSSELRMSIYAAALLAPRPNLALLQTCRQIHAEARSILYQREVKHRSQMSLFLWIDASQSADLESVTALTLGLTDVPLLDALNQDQSDPDAKVTAWRMYQDDVEQLDHAFQRLPSLRTLRVEPAAPDASLFLKSLYLASLEIAQRRCPNLYS